MAYHVCQEETLDREGLCRLQRDKLRRLLEAVRATNAFYRRRLADVSFDPATDPLTRLPFTTRADLEQDQHDHPPYGTNLTQPPGQYRRLHQTSGSGGHPLCWLDTMESWNWWKRCWGIIYRAAGVTPDDRFVFPFTFGPFIGFWGAFESAIELGNLTLAAGGMTTAARLRYMLDHGATFIGCTPTYALRMAEVARAEGIDLRGSSIRGLIVAGEPGGHIPGTRERIEQAFGARVFDHAGMTEVGPWGFECVEDPSGFHVMENEFIAEVIDPQTLAPVVPGEEGELVLTNLGRLASPLVRYRTGDHVRLIHRRCACGRWFAMVEGGILGRVDDMLVIRGNNVFPSAVEGIIRRFTSVVEFRMEVDQAGPMADLDIAVEPVPGADGTQLASQVADAIRDRLHFTPRVYAVESGSLPRFEMKAKRVIRRKRTG